MSANQIGAASKKERYRVHKGEPGQSVVTELRDGFPVIENSPVVLVPSSSYPLPSPIQDQIEEGDIISLPINEIAYYRADLIRAFNEETSKKDGPKSKIVNRFLNAYNIGLLFPAIYKKLGRVSRSTLYIWLKAFNEGGVENLAPQNGRKGISKITEDEKNYLLSILGNKNRIKIGQNRIKIGSAIRLTKYILSLKDIPSPSGERSLRRYVEQFKKDHYDYWILCREGEKALNDKVLPYAERNRDLIKVGEGLVADGHRLNFQVINPFTGKPCRPAMVLFLDWRSSYPLGFEIMLEESVQCIASALRNAILTLGKTPKWLLIDNGRAFKADVFNSSIDLREAGIYGMFLRLGIHTHFSQPYNAQAKPIERWFRTFSDWFERLQPSFTGSSIDDKPAWTKRNEKLALAARGSWTPTVPEVNEMMKSWCDFYINQPSRGLSGSKPGEIFESGRGPGVDPAQLAHLMMAMEIRTVHRNGITFLGHNWNSDALYGYRDRVVIRYSLCDLSQIYIFTFTGEFLCSARPVEKVHPMASESEFPENMEAVKRQIAQKRRLRKQTVNLYKLLGKQKPLDLLPWRDIALQVPNVIDDIEKIEAEKPKAVNISPFLETKSLPDSEIEIQNEKKENGRPWFYNDYDKYDWLMKQDCFDQEDRNFITRFRKESSLYKPKVFDDDEELDHKVRLWEERNGRSIPGGET